MDGPSKGDNGFYERYKELKQEVKQLKDECKNPYNFTLKKIMREMHCHKEMYEMAREKKASRSFIVNIILDEGFDVGAQGYLFAKEALHTLNIPTTLPTLLTWKRSLMDQQEEFRRMCNSFSKVGEYLINVVWGSDNDTYNEWKEKTNFDQWISIEREHFVN